MSFQGHFASILKFTAEFEGIVKANQVPILQQTDSEHNLLFSVEKTFRKKSVQFSTRSFFPFPDFAHDPQT